MYSISTSTVKFRVRQTLQTKKNPSKKRGLSVADLLSIFMRLQNIKDIALPCSFQIPRNVGAVLLSLITLSSSNFKCVSIFLKSDTIS